MPAVHPSDAFVAQLATAQQQHFGMVCDLVPGLSFFAKNSQFELVAMNDQFWRRLDVGSAAEVIGKNDFELFPQALAERFREDDQKVLNSGEPLLKIVELFFNRQGLPDWFLTSKVPLFDRTGEVVGLMGISRSFASHGGRHALHPALDRALDTIRENYKGPIRVPDLARSSGLSPRQFTRVFREILGTSPSTFIVKTRVQAACERLRETTQPIADVAVELGFCDQSSFTQHFRRHVGETPLQYRKFKSQTAGSSE